MNPFIRKVKTEAEKDALLLEAAKKWDDLDENSDLVSVSQEDFLAGIANSIIVEADPIEPRALTPMQKADVDLELDLASLCGGTYVPRQYSNIEAFAGMEKAEERQNLQELLGPARRAESQLESLVRGIVQKTVGNRSVPMRESERPGIMPAIAARAAELDPGSDVAIVLAAFASGNLEGMRSIARSLAEAA